MSGIGALDQSLGFDARFAVKNALRHRIQRAAE
jgi:hypothetical protein